MPVTDILRDCHRLRNHLRKLQAEIDRGPRLLKEQEEYLEAERAEHQAHHASITRLKLKQREDEVTLKETETRLAKLDTQLVGISVQKEYAAKESEIAQAKAKKSELEDTILETITTLEQHTTAIPAVERKWADAQAAFAEYKQAAAERLERLKADQQASRVALETAEKGLTGEARERYDFMVKAHGPEAMAPVKNKTCQGCRTSLAEQRMLQLKGGGLVVCPNCGKLLFPAE